jgi:hypothetical protein
MRERRYKTVYSYDEDAIFIGTERAMETWDFAEPPIWAMPANSTDIEVPKFSPRTEQARFDLKNNNWIVENIPTEQNTPKPTIDSSTHRVNWVGRKWEIGKLPSKPAYDIEKETCVWDVSLNEWVLKKIPTWDDVRKKRNNLLMESDWVMFDDVKVLNKDAWLKYRQALRNITISFSKIEDVVWPPKPFKSR